MIKVLIISSTTWDDENSFGNTFSNIFGGMQNVEIYNVACRHGKINNSVVKSSVQLTDRSVLRSIYKPKFDACLNESKICDNQNYNEEVSKKARMKRRTFSFIIRDLIWKLGKWKKSKTLTKFLEDVNPDVIYLPLYASPYMCDVQQYIVSRLNVPVIGHISDDIYAFPPKASLLEKIYRVNLRRKLKKLISKCTYLEVFAKNMQKEYFEFFDKPCYLVGKGVEEDLANSINIQYPKGSPLHLVYTGNIGDDRYKALVDIGEAISKVFNPDEVILDIYTTTPLTEKMKKEIHKFDCVRFHGAINKQKVKQVQKEADFLVHVEGFSPKAIFSAKMSFSTKIIDYMLMGKPILAYGPKEVNSIQVLKSNQIGLTAISKTELGEIFNRIKLKNVDYDKAVFNAKHWLVNERNLKTIQQEIFDRMNKLVEA